MAPDRATCASGSADEIRRATTNAREHRVAEVIPACA